MANLNKNWVLQIDPTVLKNLKRFPQKDCQHIIVVTQSLPINPFIGDIQKMKGEKNVWRRRIGSYRLFYEVLSEEKVVHVFRVERRTTQTY
ncbi:type II toxin-antitoxin system RelE/ParE family toxin [Patescibacteria group bacterium]|nr:type II toxin-antitoxin system RelE/ParE family toxin [Patescibacteria group bacterium]